MKLENVPKPQVQLNLSFTASENKIKKSVKDRWPSKRVIIGEGDCCMIHASLACQTTKVNKNLTEKVDTFK